MELISDFHTHSKYAMACSENISLEGMDITAKQKGIQLMGTADFTHPAWFADTKSKVIPAEEGLFRLKDSGAGTRFILSTEVSTVFEKDGKVKKIHNCILAPEIDVVEQINDQLSKFGSLGSDGRPTLSTSASALVEILHSISNDVFVFPAHAWTPWFGVFGAFSGFDSMEEAYEDQTMHIHAFETGLSSDPGMNWRLSKLDRYTPVSNSDAHSLPKLGREANVFSIDEDKLSYKSVIDAITKKDTNRFKMTIEFYPEEGKYHWDGHRNCNVSFSPEEAKRFNNICPVCRRRITTGVLHRVEDLADRPEGYVPKGSIPFVHAVPLQEVIAYISNKGESSQYVRQLYSKLVARFGSEFNVTLNADIRSISEMDKEVGNAIGKIREGSVKLIPGYDGVFGVVDIFDRVKRKPQGKQSVLKSQ